MMMTDTMLAVARLVMAMTIRIALPAAIAIGQDCWTISNDMLDS